MSKSYAMFQTEQALKAALEAFAAERGMTVELQDNSKDTPTYMWFGVKLNKPADVAAEAEQKAFAAKCWKVGYQPEDYKKVFFSQGHWWQLKGINPDAPTFPLIVTRMTDGKTFRFSKQPRADLKADPAKVEV